VVKALPSNTDKAMFVDLMTEGSTPTSGMNQTELRSWISALKVPFTTAYDVDPSTSFTIRKTYGIKETTYIVDRATMTIVAKTATPEDGLNALAALP